MTPSSLPLSTVRHCSPRLPSIRWSLAALLLAFSAPATAQETSASPSRSFRIFGQSTSYLEYNQAEDVGDDDYSKLKQLVAFNVEWSHVTLGAQVEYLHYSDRDAVDPLDLDRLRGDLELRKYFVDYRSDLLSARVGTFFSSLGRGLTLYVQRNETLGFDEPIHGAIATATLKHLDLSVLGGRVSEPLLQNQYGREFEDEVAGGRALVRLPLDLYLGGSFVRSKLDRYLPAGTDDVDVWSVELGGLSLGGLFDVHGEWAEIEKTERNRTKEGFGRYLSIASYVGPVTILGEYKDYWNFAYRYNSPPNAGRANESYTHDDVKGPRVLVTVDLASIDSILHASYATFDTHRHSTSPGGADGDGQTEWYAGVEQTLGPVYVDGSYFERRWAEREIEERHTLADVHLTLGQSNELVVGWDERQEQASFFSLGTTRTSLTFSRSPWGSASLRYAWEERSRFPTEDFWGLEVQYLPRPTITLTLFGGSDPGGLVCAGGQCREEPRFKGYKANFTWRF